MLAVDAMACRAKRSLLDSEEQGANNFDLVGFQRVW